MADTVIPLFKGARLFLRKTFPSGLTILRSTVPSGMNLTWGESAPRPGEADRFARRVAGSLLRVSSNGKASGFQPVNVGSIPSTRSRG